MRSYETAREEGVPIGELEATVRKFPQLDGIWRPQSREQMQAFVASVRPGTIAIDVGHMPGVSRNVQTAELIEIEDHGKTRKRSRHGVIFGQMILHSADDDEQSAYIALKPIDDTTLALEYPLTSHIAHRGMRDMETFSPVGIARMPDGEASLVTVYRHGVRSMDNIFANPALIDEEEVVRKAFRRAGMSIATPHAHNWVQVDTQTKNIAWDLTKKSSDSAFVIDLETAQPLHGMPVEQRDGLMLEDIRIFIASSYELEKKGCELPAEYDAMLSEEFAATYLNRLARYHVETDIDVSLIDQVIDEHPELPTYA